VLNTAESNRHTVTACVLRTMVYCCSHKLMRCHKA
jgi:hypothetical protein